MRSIYLIFLCALMNAGNANAQEKIYFKAEKLTLEGRVIGKNITMVYDTLFKNYIVSYTNSRDETQKIEFVFDHDNIFTLDGKSYLRLFDLKESYGKFIRTTDLMGYSLMNLSQIISFTKKSR